MFETAISPSLLRLTLAILCSILSILADTCAAADSFISTSSSSVGAVSSSSSSSTFATSTLSATTLEGSTSSVLVGPPLVAGPATTTYVSTYVTVGTYAGTSSSTAFLSTVDSSSTSTTTTTLSTSSTSGSSPASTTTTAAATHTITVGKGFNQFQPQSLNATPGSTILFQFYPLNHSVVQSSFSYPCIPLSTMNASSSPSSFFSSFFPLGEITSHLPTWTLRINDSNPIFFYCSAPGSCLDYDMVGGINLTPEQSLEAQIARIAVVDVMLQPGEPFQSEAQASEVSSLVSAASSASAASAASATSTSTSTSSSSVSATAAAPQKRNKLSAGVIAGVAVACLAVLALLYALVWFWGRNKTLREMLDLVRKREEVVVNGYNESGVVVARRRSLFHQRQQHPEIGGGGGGGESGTFGAPFSPLGVGGMAAAAEPWSDGSSMTAVGGSGIMELEARDAKVVVFEVSGDEPARAEMEGVGVGGLLVDVNEKDEVAGKD